MSVYDFEMARIDGTVEPLSKYENQVMLIVNTASKCGFTKQFEGLEKLYQTYSDQGFVVLGFPCSQFLNQEYKDDEEIVSFCQKNYGVSFPMFSKINVRGKHKAPLYEYLIEQTSGKMIQWNFTKFLVNREGEIVARFQPKVTPEEIESTIKDIL